MGLEIDRSARGKTTVLRLAGHLDWYTAPTLLETLTQLAHDGDTDVILDTDDLEFFDSFGLGALVRGFRRIRAVEGSMAIVTSDPKLVRILTLTGLDLMVPVTTVPRSIPA